MEESALPVVATSIVTALLRSVAKCERRLITPLILLHPKITSGGYEKIITSAIPLPNRCNDYIAHPMSLKQNLGP